MKFEPYKYKITFNKKALLETEESTNAYAIFEALYNGRIKPKGTDGIGIYELWRNNKLLDSFRKR